MLLYAHFPLTVIRSNYLISVSTLGLIEVVHLLINYNLITLDLVQIYTHCMLPSFFHRVSIP